MPRHCLLASALHCCLVVAAGITVPLLGDIQAPESDGSTRGYANITLLRDNPAFAADVSFTVNAGTAISSNSGKFWACGHLLPLNPRGCASTHTLAATANLCGLLRHTRLSAAVLMFLVSE